MFTLVHFVIQLIQPFLVPICFVAAWVFVGMFCWSIWSAARDSFNRAKTMHEIPCANCQFFTGNYFLKCPVHPSKALSESAINCMDYEPPKMTAAR